VPPLLAMRTDRQSVAKAVSPTAARCNPRSALARRSANWSEQVDRAAKSELVTSLNTVLKDTGLVVVAHYAGMTVAQMTEYRQRIKEAGGKVKVAKNRLAKLALKNTSYEPIADLFKGPTCLAYSKDPIAAARVSVNYAKGNEKLVILGGAMGATVLDAKAVKALADLPSLDELRAKLIGLLNAPATKIARTVKEPGAKLARVIQAKASKSEAA
jgi:large subunit ribosomal protein L10